MSNGKAIAKALWGFRVSETLVVRCFSSEEDSFCCWTWKTRYGGGLAPTKPSSRLAAVFVACFKLAICTSQFGPGHLESPWRCELDNCKLTRGANLQDPYGPTRTEVGASPKWSLFGDFSMFTFGRVLAKLLRTFCAPYGTRTSYAAGA